MSVVEPEPAQSIATEESSVSLQALEDEVMAPQEELPSNVIDRLILFLTSILFVLMLIFVITQVFTRYITSYLGLSLPWTEEAARYLLIVTSFLGAAVAMRRQEHITITALVERLSPKIRVPLELATYILILAFLVLGLQGSSGMGSRMIHSPVGTIGWLKTGHLYWTVFAGVTLMAYYTLRWIVAKGRQCVDLLAGRTPGGNGGT